MLDAPTSADAMAQLQTVGEAVAGSAMAVLPGETAADRKERIEGVKAQANDLSGLIKKKKEKPSIEASSNGTAKRKAEDYVGGGETRGGFYAIYCLSKWHVRAVFWRRHDPLQPVDKRYRLILEQIVLQGLVGNVCRVSK